MSAIWCAFQHRDMKVLKIRKCQICYANGDFDKFRLVSLLSSVTFQRKWLTNRRRSIQNVNTQSNVILKDMTRNRCLCSTFNILLQNSNNFFVNNRSRQMLSVSFISTSIQCYKKKSVDDYFHNDTVTDDSDSDESDIDEDGLTKDEKLWALHLDDMKLPDPTDQIQRFYKTARMDQIASKGFRMTRRKFEALMYAGKVSLNSQMLTKKSRTVQKEDCIEIKHREDADGNQVVRRIRIQEVKQISSHKYLIAMNVWRVGVILPKK